MSAHRESELIHALKIQLTIVNGYAQMLEREISEAKASTPKQRDYAERLRQSIDRLQRLVYDQDTAHDVSADGESDERNGLSGPSQSETIRR